MSGGPLARGGNLNGPGWTKIAGSTALSLAYFFGIASRVQRKRIGGRQGVDSAVKYLILIKFLCGRCCRDPVFYFWSFVMTVNAAQVNAPAYVKNAKLIAWVAEIAALTQPKDIYWCDG